MNLAWASGQIVGSGAGGAIANVAGDALVMILVAGLCTCTLAAITRSPSLRMPAA
jgi:hypothetical protein